MARDAFVERVDAILVLERDQWRCQICGRKTPRGLRGTFSPNAPEVDHIIPLGVGGKESYENVQCSCRDCNMKKGARPLGQMLMFAGPREQGGWAPRILGA